MSERFFAPCPRGLETALAAELTRIGAVDVTMTDGGAGFAGELALAYRANLESRIASRILWRVGSGPYRDEHGLYELVRAIDWTRHFLPTRTLRVDTAATRSPLQSLEFATLRVKDAVCDRMRDDAGVRPSIDKRQPDVRVSAYLTERDATIYVDTSGEPLFKRGYRRDAEEAPLRENLAAGLLALTGWTPSLPLLDPMCGSGTIAVEAALIAADRAPGLARTFGFQKLAWFDGPAWQRLKQTACAARPRSRRFSRATSRRAPSAKRRSICARRRSTHSFVSSKRTFCPAPRPPPAAFFCAIRRTASGWRTRSSSRASIRCWAMR
jgi:putative N6-adenine-specific DNA methylase